MIIFPNTWQKRQFILFITEFTSKVSQSQYAVCIYFKETSYEFTTHCSLQHIFRSQQAYLCTSTTTYEHVIYKTNLEAEILLTITDYPKQSWNVVSRLIWSRPTRGMKDYEFTTFSPPTALQSVNDSVVDTCAPCSQATHQNSIRLRKAFWKPCANVLVCFHFLFQNSKHMMMWWSVCVSIRPERWGHRLREEDPK